MRAILTNPVYSGTVYAGRARTAPVRRHRSPLQLLGHRSSSQPTPPDEWVVVGHVPAIVSQEQFDLV